MAPQRISPRVIVETGNYGSNNSIIDGGDGVILVDSPHRLSDAVAWRDYVATIGAVRFIVNTDHHPDHTIGNFVMPGEVVSHAETRRRLLTEAPSMEYLTSLFEMLDPEGLPLLEGYSVRVPNVVFDSRLTLHLADATVELTYQPGHTRNSIIAYLPEDRIVFSGDIVCEAGLPSFQDSRITDWFDALDVVDTAPVAGAAAASAVSGALEPSWSTSTASPASTTAPAPASSAAVLARGRRTRRS